MVTAWSWHITFSKDPTRSDVTSYEIPLLPANLISLNFELHFSFRKPFTWPPSTWPPDSIFLHRGQCVQGKVVQPTEYIWFVIHRIILVNIYFFDTAWRLVQEKQCVAKIRDTLHFTCGCVSLTSPITHAHELPRGTTIQLPMIPY